MKSNTIYEIRKLSLVHKKLHNAKKTNKVTMTLWQIAAPQIHVHST